MILKTNDKTYYFTDKIRCMYVSQYNKTKYGDDWLDVPNYRICAEFVNNDLDSACVIEPNYFRKKDAEAELNRIIDAMVCGDPIYETRNVFTYDDYERAKKENSNDSKD